MENVNFDELLAVAEKNAADVLNLRIKILAEIGEKALPEIRGNTNYANLILRFGDAESRAAEIQKRIEKLKADKIDFERADKIKLAKYTCPSCKNVNSEGSRFCEECGQKVGELPREFCKNCCTTNPPGMKFCGECGTKLDELQAQ